MCSCAFTDTHIPYFKDTIPEQALSQSIGAEPSAGAVGVLADSPSPLKFFWLAGLL